jgi:large subunit ribosomal protein L6
MSRVGKLPVQIPSGVKVEVKDNYVQVEGPKGTMTQDFSPDVSIKVEENTVIVERNKETKQARSYHGLYRQLVQNMVTGVSTGFSKSLSVTGVGYRAEVSGDSLVLNIGYSNPIEYVIPEGVSITTDGPNKVIVSGMDKQQVGQVSSEIRSLRLPEPYKGKGIKYEDERIVRKVGKAGIK